MKYAAGFGAAAAGSPSVSFGAATSAAASSAGSAGKAWSSGSNLAAGHNAAQCAAQNAVQISSNLHTGSRLQSADKVAACHHGLQAESVCASFDSLSNSGSNTPVQSSVMLVAVDGASAEPDAQQPAHARAAATVQQQPTMKSAAAAEVKAGTALHILLSPCKLLPMLGLQSSHLPQLQQQESNTQQQHPLHNQCKLFDASPSMADPCSAGQHEIDNSQPSKAQHDMLTMLGLAPMPKEAMQPQAHSVLKQDPQHTQQQAGFALQLAEVLMDHALCQREVCCDSYMSKPCDSGHTSNSHFTK